MLLAIARYNRFQLVSARERMLLKISDSPLSHLAWAEQSGTIPKSVLTRLNTGPVEQGWSLSCSAQWTLNSVGVGHLTQSFCLFLDESMMRGQLRGAQVIGLP